MAEVGVDRKEPGAGSGATVGADGENARGGNRKMSCSPTEGLGDQIYGREMRMRRSTWLEPVGRKTWY